MEAMYSWVRVAAGPEHAGDWLWLPLCRFRGTVTSWNPFGRGRAVLETVAVIDGWGTSCRHLQREGGRAAGLGGGARPQKVAQNSRQAACPEPIQGLYMKGRVRDRPCGRPCEDGNSPSKDLVLRSISGGWGDWFVKLNRKWAQGPER